MNTILDNAGLGFGLKCTKLVVTGLQHCLFSEILKEKHTPSAILFYNLHDALFERRHYSVDFVKLTVDELIRNEILLTIRNLRNNYIHQIKMLNMFANCFFTLFEYRRWRMTSVFAFQYFRT